MKVEKGKFQAMLASVKPGLAKREIFEQATHFIFTGQHLMTYNDSVCISYPFESDFQCSVKAEDLYKTLNKIVADAVQISSAETKMSIKSTRTSLNLSTVVDEDHKVADLAMKLQKSTEGEEWNPLPDNFIEGVSLCVFSASTDLTAGVLTGVLVQGDDIFTSDRHRASWFKLSHAINDVMIMRAKDALELIKFPLVKYQAHDNWLHFRTEEGVMFSVRSVLGEFRDIKWLFEETEKAEADAFFKLPDDLKDTLEIAIVMAEDEGIHTNVSISIGNNVFRCYASKRRGEVERSLSVKYTRDPVEFKINPKFLLQALSSGTTTMSLRSSRAFMSSGSFKHVMALVISAEEPSEG